MKEDNLKKCGAAGNLDMIEIFGKIKSFEHEINEVGLVSAEKQQWMSNFVRR